MPIHIINHLAQDVEGGGAGEFSLRWGSGEVGDIQLGIRIPIDELEAYIKSVRAGSPTDGFIHWYSECLSRYQMQQLIKAARRARDAVFEPDA